MTSKFFVVPFATDGDKTTVPDGTQTDGSISYQAGWTLDYSLDPAVTPLAKPVSRSATNQLFYDVTLSLQQLQIWGTPDFITSSQNEGTPYPYSTYARVLYNDGLRGSLVFESIADNNTITPGAFQTNWRLDDFSAQKLTLDGFAGDAGLVAGDVVYWDYADNVFKKALADGTAKQEAIGIWDDVYLRVITDGFFPFFDSLIPNSNYYLSTTTPGEITTTKPATNAVKIGVATNPTTMFLGIQDEADFIPPVVQPAVASVYLDASTSGIPSDTTAYKINFGAVDFDTDSLWNATFFEYIADKDGYYEFNGSVLARPVEPGANGNVYITLFKNTDPYQRLSQIYTNGSDVTPSGSTLLPLNAGDVVYLAVTNATGVDVILEADMDVSISQFSLQYIRPL